MKSKISILLVLLMIFVLMGCSSQDDVIETPPVSAVFSYSEHQSENKLKEENVQMSQQTINYTSDGRVNMETFIQPDMGKQLPAIVILPGGAFGMLDYPEGEPVAQNGCSALQG